MADAPSTSAPVVLFWGDQEFLLRLAAREHLAALGLKATEVDGSDWRGGETSDLATPSLWGESRALLVTECQGLPEAGAAEIKQYVASPAPDAVCVLTLVTRGKRTPPLAKAVEDGGGRARQVAVTPRELPGWLVQRAKARGAKLGGQAAAALVATVGEDPAALDQAVEQLASAFPGQAIGPDHVRAQFRGLGEQRVWTLCDQAFTGRLGDALVTLRSLLEAREDPLLIVGGIASRVRDLIRVRGLPERMPSADAAKAAGLRYEWQVRRYREQAGRFSPQQLIRLHAQLVECDRAVKGGAPGDVVLPSLVAAMAGEWGAQLDLDLRVSR
jgi:DNA polymerase-3 subunit delta